MATTKPNLDDPGLSVNDEPLYTVDVLQRVGVVTKGKGMSSHYPPLKVAFMMVSDYFAEHATSESNEFTFTVTGAEHPDRPISVQIND